MSAAAERTRTTPAWMGRLPGRFLVFDGPDGSGKSTQFERFLKRARGAGLDVCDVREPGGTTIGERIRDILLDKTSGEMSLRCEMLLYMASRAQLVEERIRPALARGELVLADRFVSSTYAYQGGGGGLPLRDVDDVTRAACEGVRPDLVVIFDADESTASARVGDRRDRIESRGAEYRERVRRGFMDLARREPDRHAVVDASGGPDAVERALLTELERRFA